jgi:hypothetical protein
MGATFEDEDQLFQCVMDVPHRILAMNSEQFLTSGSFDWTHACSGPEIMSNEGNLPNTFLLFYLELIWPYKKIWRHFVPVIEKFGFSVEKSYIGCSTLR